MSVLAGSFEDQAPATRHEAIASGGACGSVSAARVDGLRLRHQLRAGGLDDRHVAALEELDGRWPPLLVWAHHPEVLLDGAHRLEAARRLGHSTVQVVAFQGDADEAFVETVRRNIGHGLPLTVPDRTRAGQQVLNRHPDWSDRRIAEACGLSPHTVARLRASLPPADTPRSRRVAAKTATATATAVVGPPRVAVGLGPSKATGAPRKPAKTLDSPSTSDFPSVSDSATGERIIDIESRLGRDGKNRPAQPGMLRDRVLEAIKANPDGSLRQIAAVAKVSPETVRRIRRELEEPGGPDITLLASLRAPEEADTDWREDPALCGNPGFVTWLDRTDPSGDLEGFAMGVPLSRVYQLSDEARRRAARWAAFAEVLESRARARARNQGYSLT